MTENICLKLIRPSDVALLDAKSVRVPSLIPKNAPLPKALKLMNRGRNPSVKGDFYVSQITETELPKNQQRMGFERIAIDYNHCSVPGSEEFVTGSPKAIFGYGTPVLEQSGLVLRDITWTPLGEEHARNFEDLSPAVQPNEKGEVVFIHSVALTPNGALSESDVSGRIICNSAALKSLSAPRFQSWDTPESMLPKELPLVPWGVARWRGKGAGPITCNEETQRKLPWNQAALGLTTIKVLIPASGPTETREGFECGLCGERWSKREVTATVCPCGCPPNKSEIVAATGMPAVVKDVGLKIVDLDWTEEGRKYAANFMGLEPDIMYETGQDEQGLGQWLLVAIRSVHLSNEESRTNATPFPALLRLSAGQREFLGGCGDSAAYAQKFRRMIALLSGAIKPSDFSGLARTAAAFDLQLLRKGSIK